MRQGALSEHFTGVAAKQLSAVETDARTSNQHELNGVGGLRSMLGDGPERFATRLIYLDDEGGDPVEADAAFTRYNARARDPRRNEWRLYFPDNPVFDLAQAGDLLVIGLRPDRSLLAMVAPAGSTVAGQLLWLFGLGGVELARFAVSDVADLDDASLAFAARPLLDEHGKIIPCMVSVSRSPIPLEWRRTLKRRDRRADGAD